MEHHRLVVFLVAGAIEEGDRPTARKLHQFLDRCDLRGGLAELCSVTAAKRTPPLGVVPKPLPKLVRRTNVTKPKIQVEG